jgi:protein-disulfide isomerase
MPSPDSRIHVLPITAAILLVLALGACTGEDTPARQVTEDDTAAARTQDGRVPAGRLPEGATYDFGAMRGGEAEVGGAYYIGRSDAPVTVATFGDFECQFCARSEAATAPARTELLEAGTVRVFYLDFPLPMHARGRPAAEFARCVGRTEGPRAFWRAYRTLHRTQDRWTDARTVEDGLRTVADKLGASWPEAKSCMDADTELPAVVRFQRLGRRVGIRGTPTSFFNGVPRVGAITEPVFRRMVDAALSGER